MVVESVNAEPTDMEWSANSKEMRWFFCFLRRIPQKSNITHEICITVQSLGAEQ